MDQCPFSNSLPSRSRADVNSAGGPASSVLPMGWDGIRSHCPCYCWCQWLPCDALWIGHNWLAKNSIHITYILTKQRTKNLYSTSTAHNIWRETCHISWKWDRGSLNVWIQINPSSSNFSFTSIHPYIAQGMWKCLGLVSFKRFCFSQANYIILIICPHLYIAKFRCMKRTAK